jgi:hypothetical protein
MIGKTIVYGLENHRKVSDIRRLKRRPVIYTHGADTCTMCVTVGQAPHQTKVTCLEPILTRTDIFHGYISPIEI